MEGAKERSQSSKTRQITPEPVLKQDIEKSESTKLKAHYEVIIREKDEQIALLVKTVEDMKIKVNNFARFFKPKVEEVQDQNGEKSPTSLPSPGNEYEH